MKIVRTDRELQTPVIDASLKKAGHELVLLPDGISEDELIEHISDADLILMCYTPITRKVIEAAKKLKGIVKYGVGIDAIDIAAAIENGLPVVNIPEYAEETVAEGAFAMLIALAKKLPAIQNQMENNGWAWPEPKWLGSDIAGKTLGIVGFGKIGKSMARMASHGFRAKVIAFSPHTDSQEMKKFGVTKYNSLNQLLSDSDFVSIHSVLNSETEKLIGEKELRHMKSSSILINSARGAIVDEKALIKAIKEKWISGLGLDVFSQEPLNSKYHPMKELYGRPNVILMPHLTFYTDGAMDRLETETLERCYEILDGKKVLVKSLDPRLLKQSKSVIIH